MIEIINENPKVYRIYVPLPQNPLKNLNSFVIDCGERNLIIDTGFNREECYEVLKNGLDELKIDMSKTDIFFTHLHSDHCGLVNKIMSEASHIFMGKIDYEYLVNNLEGDNWSKIEKRFEEEGFPNDVAGRLRESNQARKYAPNKVFEATTLEDGDKFRVGNLEFTGIFTPGHTPGHMCLYLENEKILFSGDHILFDITPNITAWLNVEDSLKDYIESLKRVRDLEVEITFPGHREKADSLYERIEELLLHHQERLEDAYKIIEENQGKSAYEIASLMKWNLRGRPWSEFPDNQKWFATGETMSHLDYLINEKRIRKEKLNETNLYVYYLNN